jgi:hypothetical protein
VTVALQHEDAAKLPTEAQVAALLDRALQGLP